MIPTENVSVLSSVLLVATREPSNDVTPDLWSRCPRPTRPTSHPSIFAFPPGSKHPKWTPSAMNIRMDHNDCHTQ